VSGPAEDRAARAPLGASRLPLNGERAMEPNVVLPLTSSLLSFVFALFLLDQWLERRRPYQLIWTIGMLWYGISAGTEFVGGAFGWSEPLYRAWYLTGAVWVAGWLGLGTMYLLAKTRFGYGAAFSVLLAGLFTFLTWRKNDYPDSGISPYLYLLIAIVAAVAIGIETYRAKGRWANLAGALIVVGTLVSIPMVVLAPLAAPGYALDPATGIPSGELFPGYVRLLTPFFNITGGFALVLGALYSAYVFMPKRRVIRYDLRRDQGVARFLLNLALAPIAIGVNLVASIPGAVAALFRGELNSRVPSTILIALGGFFPSLTGSLARFGATEAFFLGELLGVLFLFAGFLVSIEVFRVIRIPFTHVVLYARKAAA
jgi:hypothetical protein